MINRTKLLISKKINLNYIFNLFLLFYLIIGLFLSLRTGVSTDAFIEEDIWTKNLELIKDFFGKSNDANLNLLQPENKYYGDPNLLEHWNKYFGIGFNFLSQLYILLAGLIMKFDGLSNDISRVLLKHNLIFFTYFLSGIFAKKIVNLLIKDRFYSNIFLIFYLFYPYLIGHGFFNNQDMPFLCAWILSTYLSIKIFLKILKSNNISFLNIFFISLSTSFLISIRISGILILLQYFITFIITSRLINESIYQILKIYFFKLFLFVLLTFALIILFNPIFWLNPLLFFDSINQMRNIQFGICTLTLGNCMDALNLPSSYIFIWLFFKLPLLSFIGLILFPFIENFYF